MSGENETRNEIDPIAFISSEPWRRPAARVPHIMTLNRVAPAAGVALWLGLVGLGMWLAAGVAQEPPSMDPLSYLQKAAAFWDAITAGRWVNPFDIAPTVRPPGTILMSYPFGFTPDFQGFYFRSTFLPVVLLTVAVYVACPGTPGTLAQSWPVGALALTLAGAPMLFQFQATDELPAASFWGLTDGFLAGLASAAMAAAMRSARTQSFGWAVAAALSAALCFFIKPAGMLMMAVVGLAWLVLAATAYGTHATAWREDIAVRRFVLRSLAAATAIYATALYLAFTSAYFSAANILYGTASLNVMRDDFTFLSNFDPSMFLTVLHISVGVVIPTAIAAGFAIVAINREPPWAALAAAVSLLIGLWFWVAQTGLEVVRYFLPFPAMAFVLLAPIMLAAIGRAPGRVQLVACALAAAPPLISTALLFHPAPPPSLQRVLGINLFTNAYGPENRQSADWLKELSAAGAEGSSIYIFDATPELRNFYASIEYANTVDASAPRIAIFSPRDWQRATTYRLAEIAGAEYIAFTAMPDDAMCADILARREVADFETERYVVSAWFSTLTPEDGVEIVSETRVRLLKVTDRAKLMQSLERLRTGYDFSARFRAANPEPRNMLDEVADVRASGTPQTVDVSFRTDAEPVQTLIVRAAEISVDDGLRPRFWIDATGAAAGSRWVLFTHLLDAQGQVIGNAQSLIVAAPPTDETPLHFAATAFAVRPPTAVQVGYGIFREGSDPLDLLRSSAPLSDWDGKRVLVPLPGR